MGVPPAFVEAGDFQPNSGLAEHRNLLEPFAEVGIGERRAASISLRVELGKRLNDVESVPARMECFVLAVGVGKLEKALKGLGTFPASGESKVGDALNGAARDPSS